MTAKSTKAALGRSGIRLVYACAVHRAVHTCVVLNHNSWGYIQSVYALNMQLYIHLCFLLMRSAAAHAIIIINIYCAYAIP